MSKNRTHAEDMSPLEKLLTEQMRRRGWDANAVKRRSGIPHATLYRYTHPVELKSPPRRDTVEQLANALELNPDLVWKAAVDSVGWHVAPSKHTDAFVARPDQATADTVQGDREVLERLDQILQEVAELRARFARTEVQQDEP